MSAETSTQSGRGGLIAAVLFFIAAIGAGAWLGFGGSDGVNVSPLDGNSPPFAADGGRAATASSPRILVEPQQQAAAQSEAHTMLPTTAPSAAAVTTSPAEEAPALDPASVQVVAEQPALVTPPSFDEIRREDDGTTVVAGRATPGARVSVKVDGTEVATARADTTGSFAAISKVPGTNAPQVMTLEAEGNVLSNEEIILAPLAPLPAPIAQIDVSPPIVTPTTSPQRMASQPAPEAGLDPAPRVAILKSDESGVQLLTPRTPSAMSRVALDTIGYAAGGEVQLSGRAQTEAKEVRIYLDNNAVVSLPVGSDGRWHGDLPNVDEGVYTLRVDEVRADGTVSSRVETPFKRESASVLANAQRDADGNIVAITVQKGNTLWAIARERYGQGTLYVKVFDANRKSIRDPDLIYPGQVFDLPK